MLIENYIQESIDTKTKILNDKSLCSTIEEIARIIIKALGENKKILLVGNGGSAADAQHIATEMVVKFEKERKGIAAIALTTDTSVLTATGNDYGFEEIFAKQVEAIGQKGDVLIAISTSGNSKNIIKAISKATEEGLITVGLTGKKGCCLDELCNYVIKIPSVKTPIIQESHIMIGHILCNIIENNMCKE